MKNCKNRLWSHRYFLLFIMLFAYVQSIFIRISAKEQINSYTFTPEGALFTIVEAGILFSIIRIFIQKWQKSAVFTISEILKIFSFSVVIFLLTMKIFGLFISFLFGTIERNFNTDTFVFTLFSDFLNAIIYGSFFLAYYYYKKNEKHQKQLASYNQSLSESKIYQLKSQLNPHFLFNNLNVLDQLIDEDKNKASIFLNEFADIYRYVLQASEKKVINIIQELDFAKQYFKIIQHKYGNAYQLNIECNNPNGWIVPLTLQLLIENAVQHNLGTEERPVYIKITIDKNICTSNNIIAKRSTKIKSGRALENLKEQYYLLAKTPIDILQLNNQFLVTIPIIYEYDL